MLDYLINNKEWLFSGVGVFVLSAIGSVLFIRNNKEDRTKAHSTSTPKTENEVAIKPVATTEVEKLAQRFRKVLELMNEGRNHSKFTIPQLARIMKLHSISELEGVFIGKKEPSFQFITDFSTAFGINEKWLIEGVATPYSSSISSKGDPLDYLEDIESIKPESIYFIREKTETSCAFILLKLTKWKYVILDRTWHISDHVGHGGQRQLLSFYKLIKKLRDEKRMHTSCWGLTLEKDLFDALLCGEKFPGQFTDTGFSEDPWWDDLTDINHKYPIAENYERWHGKSFIKAQEIIRWKLSETGS